MKKRLISAIIMLAIVIPLIIIGEVPFIIAVALIATLAYKELSDLYNYPLPVKIGGYLSLLLIIYHNYDANNIIMGFKYSALSIIMLLFFIPIVFYQIKGKYSCEDAFKYLGFIFMIGLGLNYFIVIRDMNIKYFFFMLLIPIFTDTFAYLGGMLIGKHKVTKLSPKKSWEGYIIGSLMGTFIMSMYYYTFIGKNSNIALIVLVVFLMTVVGQIGDLFFSAIKREHDIKDFSNLIPGHGGIMDRLDSLVFVSYLFMIFMDIL